MDRTDIEIQYLDRWFANIVDSMNYNLGQIEIAVPALLNQLTTLDTAPIENLSQSLNNLAKSMDDFEERLKALEQKGI